MDLIVYLPLAIRLFTVAKEGGNKGKLFGVEEYLKPQRLERVSDADLCIERIKKDQRASHCPTSVR